MSRRTRNALIIDTPMPESWTARWIESIDPTDGPDVQRPAYQMASEIMIDEPIASAFLHTTAHGVYEAFVNGERVGDIELTPGFNAYRSRLHVHTFEVTALLVEGCNALGALLSDGWWAARCHRSRHLLRRTRRNDTRPSGSNGARARAAPTVFWEFDGSDSEHDDLGWS